MIYSKTRTFNADTHTPVQLYLQLRHHYRNCCLLESNDYHSRQDSRSFIGFDPLVSIELKNSNFEIKKEGETVRVPVLLDSARSTKDSARNAMKFAENVPLDSARGTNDKPESSTQVGTEVKPSLTDQVQKLLNEYTFQHPEHNGFFGRMSFEFAHQDETHLTIESTPTDIPLLHLFLFRYVIVIDHFTNEGVLLENSFSTDFQDVSMETFMRLPAPSILPFETIGKESASFSDSEFSDLVKNGIHHCKRGDVFQLVLSNAFQQTYFGDDFHVYRQLRRTNPSPYLFYFDFESYRLFGSSPEAQTVVKNGKVEIHPIAGTVPKTGEESVDAQQLEFLKKDEKENAEHTMLVDLARNDLSRNCSKVLIEAYKEIQHFSHVIHLVSKVTGQTNSDETFKTVSQAFPAGTLSGTPKPRAMELIHQYEKNPRGFYGGAIGMLQPNGNANMAIVIRSILSKENQLHYQAGAGIVLDSDPERETQEVHHKLKAVREAIRKAHSFQSETEKTATS
ncbi:MAG: anthranilate synthase component I family protein [Fluviicola sp.]